VCLPGCSAASAMMHFREQALGPLREAGTDLVHLLTAPGCATALSMIAVLPNGQKSIILANNANDVSDEEDVRRAG
jgi:sugar/nucleoside kinase (ribokinase family)